MIGLVGTRYGVQNKKRELAQKRYRDFVKKVENFLKKVLHSVQTFGIVYLAVA